MHGISRSCPSPHAAYLQGFNTSMDMIRTLQHLLHPVIERTAVILTESHRLDGRTNRRYGLLEYHGTGSGDQIVLLACTSSRHGGPSPPKCGSRKWCDGCRPRRASNRSLCIVGYGRMGSSRTATRWHERSSPRLRPGSNHTVRPNRDPKRRRPGPEPRTTRGARGGTRRTVPPDIPTAPTRGRRLV